MAPGANQDSGYSQVTAEEFLDYEGVDYRSTSGSRGPQFNIKTCPTCGGNSWKVYLSQDSGFGNCFHGSCGASFNLWTFAKALLGTDDSKTIGQKFDEIAKTGGWKPKRRVKHAVAPPIVGELQLPMSLPIPDGNIPYLADRGVSVQTAREFGMRVCHQGVFKYVDEEGAPKQIIFSGRIIIPISDLDNKVVTFQGRDFIGNQDPKYLFPARLPSTARFLYNGQRAAAAQWGHIVMGEGAFDTIAIQCAIDADRSLVGIGAVGSFGKKLTLDAEPGMETQLQALIGLKRLGLHTITIMWDGEAKALLAAVTAAKRLTGIGFHVRVALLPPGKDPAEVTTEVIRKSIRLAVPYSTALYLKVRLKNPYGK